MGGRLAEILSMFAKWEKAGFAALNEAHLRHWKGVKSGRGCFLTGTNEMPRWRANDHIERSTISSSTLNVDVIPFASRFPMNESDTNHTGQNTHVKRKLMFGVASYYLAYLIIISHS